MAELNAEKRKNLKSSDFAIPPDRYPIQDKSHAVNALARVEQNGSAAEKRQVRTKVCHRYPDLTWCQTHDPKTGEEKDRG